MCYWQMHQLVSASARVCVRVCAHRVNNGSAHHHIIERARTRISLWGCYNPTNHSSTRTHFAWRAGWLRCDASAMRRQLTNARARWRFCCHLQKSSRWNVMMRTRAHTPRFRYHVGRSHVLVCASVEIAYAIVLPQLQSKGSCVAVCVRVRVS